MNTRIGSAWVVVLLTGGCLLPIQAELEAGQGGPLKVVLSCSPGSDLLGVLKDSGVRAARFDTPAEAVDSCFAAEQHRP